MGLNLAFVLTSVLRLVVLGESYRINQGGSISTTFPYSWYFLAKIAVGSACRIRFVFSSNFFILNHLFFSRQMPQIIYIVVSHN